MFSFVSPSACQFVVIESHFRLEGGQFDGSKLQKCSVSREGGVGVANRIEQYIKAKYRFGRKKGIYIPSRIRLDNLARIKERKNPIEGFFKKHPRVVHFLQFLD